MPEEKVIEPIPQEEKDRLKAMVAQDLEAPPADDDHAECGPSSLYRILNCPGSLNACRQVPKHPSSKYARFGTLKHEWVPRVFDGGEGVMKTALDLEGNPMEEEDKQHVYECVDYVYMLLASCSPQSRVYFERRVNLGKFGLPEIWGTSDLIIVDPVYYLVHVVDWKFGAGVPVFAENNEQLMAYGLGALDFIPEYITEAYLHIVQPPLKSQDKWSLRVNDLTEWCAAVLTPGLDAAYQMDAPLVPGTKQCRFCDARFNLQDGSVCKARHKRAVIASAEIFNVGVKLDRTPINDLVKLHNEHIRFYKKYMDDIAKLMLAHALSGGKVPTKKLVNGRGSRDWIDEKAAGTYLMENTPVEADQIYPAKLVSPAQAEGLYRKLKKDDNFKALYKTTPGKLQLVDDTDKREEVQKPTTGEVFADIDIDADF